MKITNIKKINLSKKDVEDLIRKEFNLSNDAKMSFDLEDVGDDGYVRMIFTGITIDETLTN